MDRTRSSLSECARALLRQETLVARRYSVRPRQGQSLVRSPTAAASVPSLNHSESHSLGHSSHAAEGRHHSLGPALIVDFLDADRLAKTKRRAEGAVESKLAWFGPG